MQVGLDHLEVIAGPVELAQVLKIFAAEEMGGPECRWASTI